MQAPLNKKLEEIRYMSYFDGREEICKYIMFYLRFDISWYEVYSGDGKSKFELIEEPKIVNLNSFNENDLAYPITKFNNFNKSDFKNVILIQECFRKGKLDSSYGFLISFEENKFISILDDNDILSINFNKDDVIFRDITLAKIF